MLLRLLVAAAGAAIIGFEREHSHKSAGLRTHMLVAIGTCVFVLTAVEAGAEVKDVTRVIQGTAAGIGFIGAGAILKLTDRERVRGLTTAAGVWATAALGAAAALGRLWIVAFATALTWFVLSVLERFEPKDRGKLE